MDASLKPPISFEAQEAKSKTLGKRRFIISPEKKDKLEAKIEKMINHWKTGASPLHKRLRKLNDHLEGVAEDVDFPWANASKITTGLAAGMCRTLKAIFDRAVFPDNKPFAVKPLSGNVSKERNEIEDAVNWLSMEDNNLVSEMRDSPLPIFRDGTMMLMGEWERRVEKACDYRTYKSAEAFAEDYPTADDAGIKEEKYDSYIRHLNLMDASLEVEFIYDELVYDAPRFQVVPLHNFVFFPLSAEELSPDCIIYGRQFSETAESAKAKVKRKIYDKKAGEEAIEASKVDQSDAWATSRESLEGLHRSGDEVKRLECYKLVLRMDLDEDDIPEKYLLTFEMRSRRILKIERYRLRKNIDCVVAFRFIKRDGRLLGTSLLDDGLDQFEMVDTLHRHRQNVRSITDSPSLLIPEGLKEHIDLGAEDMAYRPGLTFWLPDRYMKEGMAPRQMILQSLSKTNESMDEEQSIVRYLEFRLGPSQGLSGQESMTDPRAPASKHLSQLRQATLRIDDMIREWKRSVPGALNLMVALYYQYFKGDEIEYGKQEEIGKDLVFEKLEKDLFKAEDIDFSLKHQEISLSPEFEMEKYLNMAVIAAQNPMILMQNPKIGLELWNRYVLAARAADPDALLVEMPKEGSPFAQMLQDGNNPPQDEEGMPQLGAPTLNQESMASFGSAAPKAQVPQI